MTSFLSVHPKSVVSMHKALDRLKCVFPNVDNTVGFEITHICCDGGWVLPEFYACNELSGWRNSGKTPESAVNGLIRGLHITSVEEYIRTKAYEAKQVRV